MADLNLKRFVDINLVPRTTSKVNAIRDTVLLFTNEAESSITLYLLGPFSSYAEAEAGLDETTFPLARRFAKAYFDYGGNKLVVRQAVPQTEAGCLEMLKTEIPDEYIVFTMANNGPSATANLYAAFDTYSEDTNYDGIKSKILIGHSTDTTYTDEQAAYFKEHSEIRLCMKYDPAYNPEPCSEMSIAAYLSNIDFDGIDTVQDYMYTKEPNVNVVNVTETQLDNILKYNMNVTVKLANNIVNLGGNMLSGLAITNTFALIVLQQVLTQKLVNLLFTKLKGSSGLAAIQSAVAEEMPRWINNGYLATDKIWQEDDLKVTYNGNTYTIIQKNTPLTLGYYFYSLPISSLSDDDKQAKKAPPMYLIVADIYGIRYVTINGYVI